METNKICPNCRKPLPPDVPLGLCPECLIKSGFPTESGGGVSGEAAGARFVPPPVEEIARLFPQLEILGLIGKGGMGAVYKARQPALDRFVALKVLPPAVGSDPGFAERFNREARALARLNHPNIVAVHDFGKAGPLHYLVMEFVDGTNLREVEHAGRLSPEQALTIVPQICEALQFAHNEGIVHRDIKPENLLMDKKGRVKITDFGIAKIVGQPGGKAALTGAKDVVGTPHYMAPEQIEQPQTVDHRADIYSLGVVFYEMLTGELPLGKFAPPSSKVQMDVRLDEVVLHTLEKEPARRYQHVSQVKTDVETIAGTVPPAAGFAAKGGAAPFPGTSSNPATSDKALLPALLLAFPFGIFGAHRFYVGKIWTASIQLGAFVGCILLIIACATLGRIGQPVTGILLGFLSFGCVIWAMIDWILILCKGFTDGQGRRMTHWLHPQNGDLKTGASLMAGPPSSPPPGGAASPASAGPTPPPAPETFARATVSPSPRTGHWPWILAAIAAVGVIFVGLIIAVVLALWPAGGNPNVTVRGTVTDAVTGKPIAGARVDDNRYGAGTDRTPQQAWTDAKGHYELKTWYEEHNIAASAAGYETKMSTLLTKAFGSEHEKRIDFKLQPQNPTPAPATASVPLTYQWYYQQQGGTNPPASPGGTASTPASGPEIERAQIDTNKYAGAEFQPESGTPLPVTARVGKTGEPDTKASATFVPPVPPVPGVPPAPPVPAVSPVTANSERPAQPTTGTPAVQSESYASRTKIIGQLVTSDAFRQDFNQTLPLAADGRFSLDNVNGRIEIVGLDRNEVVIQALKHGKTSEGVDATKIEVDAQPGHIVIHTKQPSSRLGGKKDNVNVDYAIQVPRHARLANISSVNGKIAIHDVSGDIEASTVNGETQIQDAAGDLKLSTVNGRIEAELASLGRGQNVSFSTVNGQIEATLPAHADAAVTASSVNGGISSEFPSLVVKKEFPLGRNLKGTLGKGGARVKASSVNGGIHFRQGQDPR